VVIINPMEAIERRHFSVILFLSFIQALVGHASGKGIFVVFVIKSSIVFLLWTHMIAIM
jgi:hypothetical protein